jgi:hypothetical protein
MARPSRAEVFDPYEVAIAHLFNLTVILPRGGSAGTRGYNAYPSNASTFLPSAASPRTLRSDLTRSHPDHSNPRDRRIHADSGVRVSVEHRSCDGIPMLAANSQEIDKLHRVSGSS